MAGQPKKRLTNRRMRLVYNAPETYLVQYGPELEGKLSIKNLSKGELATVCMKFCGLNWNQVASTHEDNRRKMIIEYMNDEASWTGSSLWHSKIVVPKFEDTSPVNGTTPIYTPTPQSEAEPIIVPPAVQNIPSGLSEERAREIAVEESFNTLVSLQDELRRELQELKDNQPKITRVILRDQPAIDIAEHTHPMFPKMLKRHSKGANLFLTGPAGTGKTFMAEQLGRTIGIETVVISCDPTMTKGSLMGVVSPGTGLLNPGPVAECLEFGKIGIFDEVDASNPAAMVVLNNTLSALVDSRFRLADGRVITKHRNCSWIATANTFGTGPTAEHIGRNSLDAATLDRWTLLHVGYDTELERTIGSQYLGAERYGKLAQLIRSLRENREKYAIKVVISTRGVVDICKMLDPDDTIEELMADRILKSLKRDQVEKLFTGIDSSWKEIK